MIGISKLYCGAAQASDVLRYNRKSKDLPSHLLQFAADKKPVVVWNFGRRCNLRCVHCYSQSLDKDYEGELTTEEGKHFLDDIAQFGSPVILFSGGEPFMREDLFELIAYAKSKGLRAVISTNGTLITKEKARLAKEIGLSYIGVSLDGLREVNDSFRGLEGAFDMALAGIRNAQEAGVKVGLRFTINKRNYKEIPAIFDLIEEENIPRCCFYHLVYSGRGSKLVEEDLNHQQTRETIDLIIDRTADLHRRGKEVEILTVDNHADGVYTYLRMLREGSERADDVMELLNMNSGNSSGIGIACVDNLGNVWPDQFWRTHTFGNVKERPFSEIWMDRSDELMNKLKEKKKHVKGRCHDCKYLEICGGNFRARAESVTGDTWAPDPACYLTDEEIGIK